jgi:hypothetical protein
MDGTGLGSCPLAGFDIIWVELRDSTTRELGISKMDRGERGYEMRYMELAQNNVQRRILILAPMNNVVLLPVN